MAKNVIIACDGTNNSLERDLTNVALLTMVAEKIPGRQHVYYDVGVGAEPHPGMLTRIGATASQWAGLAFGAGLVENVAQAYREIVEHYDDGDRLFLLGFSRGAYSVRVLTGLLLRYGLLTAPRRHEVNRIVSRFQKLFPMKGSREEKVRYMRETFAEAARIKRDWSRPCSVHFLGIWDTVSSLGWAYDPKTFPNTARMPDVGVVRHALAIDERRAKFRTNRVRAEKGQDFKEVWFPGVHSDVGGGYPAKQDVLGHICLRWMLGEARQHGLLVDDAALRRLGLDGPATQADEAANQNESLQGLWWALEYLKLPHRRQVNGQWIDEEKRYGGTGWRTIDAGDRVSRSLQRRIATVPVRNASWETAMPAVVWEDWP